MRRAVVVGVDGSPESLRAAAVARRIAEAAGARLQVTHAVPEKQLAKAVGRVPVYVDGVFEQTLADARRRIATKLRDVVEPAVIRTLDVRAGRAARVVSDSVARCRAGLVVLGGKRHGRLSRAFGGSTAHYLVRVLDIPVLITATAATRRVLIAIDRSPAAGRTLAEGIALARLVGARVRVLHVVEPIRYTAVVARAPDFERFLQRSRAALARSAARVGIAASDTAVRQGVVADAIRAEAAAWRADLIVVGSQGKGFVDRLLIGSTTEALLERLPASLVVVPVARGKGRRSGPAR